jgi:type I restriction enzyme S subunit
MNFKIDKTNWKKVKLIDVCEWYQKNIANDSQVDFGIKYYVTANHIDSDSTKFKRYNDLSDGQKGPTITKHFEKGNLLLSTRSVALRKASVAPVDGVTGEKLLVLRLKENSELIEALMPYVFQSIDFWGYAQNSASGSVNKFTSWTKIREYEFFLPPKDQQTELAKLLSAMDGVIDSNWTTLESLKKYKKRVSYDCYYSTEVDKMNLEDLTIKIQDGSHFSPKNIYKENDGTKFRYVTSKNIRVSGFEFKEDQYIDKAFHDSIYPRCDVKKGDVLLTKDGASTGAATLNSLDEQFSLLSSVCLIRSNEKTTNEYLCQYINSDIGNYNLINQMTGTAITRLTLTTLRKVKIPVPKLEKQTEVVKELNSIDKGILSSIEAIKKGQSLQKTLINQVF